MPTESKREVVSRLRERARSYQPRHDPMMRLATASSGPYSRRKLREIVQEHSLAATNPNSAELETLRSATGQLVASANHRQNSFEQVKAQLKSIAAELDKAFFFGLLRGDVGRSGVGEPLMKLDIRQVRPGEVPRRRGSHCQGDRAVTVFVSEKRHVPLDKYIGTLAHEMAHSYLFIFARDFVVSAEEHHNLEWCGLFLFIIDWLLV